MSRNTSAIIVTLLAMTILAPRLAMATFPWPLEVPVERLIRNTEAYIKENPKDPAGPYTLGRIHYLALSLKTRTLRVWERGKSTVLLERMFNDRRTGQDTEITKEEMAAHLSAALENYRKAIGMEEKNGLFHLGLASVMEFAINEGLAGTKDDKGEMQPPPGWRADTMVEYFKAYELSIEKDLTNERQPMTGLSNLAAYEAGTRYVAMAKAQREVSKEESDRVDRV